MRLSMLIGAPEFRGCVACPRIKVPKDATFCLLLSSYSLTRSRYTLVGRYPLPLREINYND